MGNSLCPSLFLSSLTTISPQMHQINNVLYTYLLSASRARIMTRCKKHSSDVINCTQECTDHDLAQFKTAVCFFVWLFFYSLL